MNIANQHVSEAVEAWRKADGNLWTFAEKASRVSGADTKKLADKIGRKEDTVEGYRAVWLLWCDVLKHYPAHAEEYRADLYIGHWREVAKKYAGGWIELDDAMDYLRRAKECGWRVEDLRQKLPHAEQALDFSRAAKWVDRNFIHAPRLNMGAKVVRAAKLFYGRLMQEAE